MSMCRSMKRRGAAALLAAGVAAALSGCATLTGSTEQEVVVRTILDHREVAGVGCLLTNSAGRWFVTAPGRVTIQKNAGALTVDCSKDGVGAASERVDSHFATANVLGNVVVSAGLGYFVDRRSGAGFDYPVTLTVLMRRPPDAGATVVPDTGAGRALY